MNIVIAILLFLILCALLLIARNIAGLNNNFIKTVTHFNKVLAGKLKDK